MDRIEYLPNSYLRIPFIIMPPSVRGIMPPSVRGILNDGVGGYDVSRAGRTYEG